MNLKKIAAALRDLAAALEEEGASSTPLLPVETPSPAKLEEIELADVQEAGAKVLKAGMKKEFRAVLTQFGLPNLSSAKEKDYPAILAALQELGRDL